MADLRPSILLCALLALVAQATAGCMAPATPGTGTSPAASDTAGSTDTNAATTATTTQAGTTAPSQPAGTPVASLPQYTVGDQWILTTTIRSDAGGLTYTSTSSRHVAALEPHTIPSGTYDAVRLEETVAFENAPRTPTTNTTSWFAVSDGSLLDSIMDRTQPNPLGGSTHTRIETRMDSPCLQYKWPLTLGATWDSHCTGTQRDLRDDGTASSESPYTLNQTRTVQGQERVTVPAGTFDTVQVLVTSSTNGGAPTSYTDWYAAAACTQAKASAHASGTTVDVVLDSDQCAKA
jgi:hypothetical protein